MQFWGSVRPMRKGFGPWMMAAAFMVLFSPVRAWPWGCEAHQSVAMIAENHMTAHALEAANKLLRGHPIDPALSSFCSSQGLDLMADSSTWADDVRGSRPETGPWHYINIPREAPRSALAESCPASVGCVTSAIEHQTALLRNDRTDARVRGRPAVCHPFCRRPSPAFALRFQQRFGGQLRPHQLLWKSPDGEKPAV